MTFSITKLTKLASLFTLATVALIASQAKADVYDHIDRYAMKIQRKTKVLLNETIHYRHTPQYIRLVRCTNELNKLATHIHDVTHFEGNLFHLRADLRDLDTEFHLLEGLFDQIEESAACGHGRIQGNTAHVKALLNSIEDNIHHIQDDVETLTTPVVVCNRTPVVTRPVYTPTRPVYVPTRPVYTAPTRTVYVPTRPVRQGGISIDIGGSRNGHRHDDYAHGRSRGRGHGHGHGGHAGHGRNSGGGFGFSIGGGSSRLVFGF